MLDLRRVRHFTTTAEAGSFARAAEILGLSQPALSRSIQSIEVEYGLQLFHRRRGLALTPAGESLLHASRALLGAAEALDRQLQRLGRDEAGQVAFGLGPLPASIYLPALIARVAEARPGIQLRVVVAGGAEIVRRAVEGELDFCCCCADLQIPPQHRIDTSPLATLPIVRIVRAAHPLARGEGDPADFPLIGGTGGGETEGYRPRIVCDDFGVLKRTTLATDLVWLTAPQAAAPELADGRLVELPRRPEDHALAARLVVFRPAARTLSSTSTFVLTALRQMMAGA